jgi:alpha-beta hydrolase superfamily lysophospholipase
MGLAGTAVRTRLSAGTLSQDQGFEVLVPDLRGHGPNPVRRGDIDYIGQLEDDLADLIAAHNITGRPVYMVGHSSGGGLVVRFAGGPHGALLNKAVLMPALYHKCCTLKGGNGNGFMGEFGCCFFVAFSAQ